MALTLPKSYGDNKITFANDVHQMWDALEALVNGQITADYVQSGWASWSQVTLSKDVNFYFGAESSSYMKFIDSTAELQFVHATDGKKTIWKINGTQIGEIDSSKNMTLAKDAYFPSSASYPLGRIALRYAKPIIQYVSATQVSVENNTEVSNETFIVFPCGPIAVQEDISLTHKFRKLDLGATANGYINTHVGAADSGLRVGLALAANTWYFVYAVKVSYGDDVGKFILVVDDTEPTFANYSTLDTRYGAGYWVYLGALRRGFGSAQTTTLVPFIYDKQGWCSFTSRAAANDYFGICVVSAQVITSSTSVGWEDVHTFSAGNSGEAFPSIMSALQIRWKCEQDGDSDLQGNLALGSSTSNQMMYLPSFGQHFENTAHANEAMIPNGQGYKFLAQRHFGNTSMDFALSVYISGFMDDFI